jgi:hypothetical protein
MTTTAVAATNKPTKAVMDLKIHLSVRSAGLEVWEAASSLAMRQVWRKI